jgi:integrase
VEASYAPATTKKYLKALSGFVNWCDESGENPSTYQEMDEVMVDYIHFLYESGMGKSEATCAIYAAVMVIPVLKAHLHLSRMALRGWHRLHPSQSYPPLTWELTVAIASRVRSQSPVASIGLLLAFDCYLRLGELLSLRRSDIADSGDARHGVGFSGMALRLRKTKTGANQWVTVENADVLRLLRGLLSALPPQNGETLLFAFSPSVFRRMFKSACRDLGLSSLYVPHSLRHGAATRDHFDRKKPMEDILQRGRWASTKSARRYIQSGPALRMATQVPPRVAELGALIATGLFDVFSLSQ